MKIENEKSVPCERKMLYYYFDGKEWSLKWEEKFEISDLVQADILQELESIHQQILDGKLSPLAFHVRKYLYGCAYILTGRDSGVSLLSAYTGISKRNIKKHLKPKNFKKLDENTLKKYAEVFEISIEELINV